MKLTNQQVSALADKIYNQIKGDIEKVNKELKSPINFSIWIKKNKETVDTLNKCVEYAKKYVELTDKEYRYDNFLEVSNTDINQELKTIFENSIETKQCPYKDEIKQDIILETIECENLDSIITKLVDKYTK